MPMVTLRVMGWLCGWRVASCWRWVRRSRSPMTVMGGEPTSTGARPLAQCCCGRWVVDDDAKLTRFLAEPWVTAWRAVDGLFATVAMIPLWDD